MLDTLQINNIPPIELVIFDCDGVLIDSEIISKRILLDELNKLGIVIDDDYFMQYCLGRSFGFVEQKISTDFQTPFPKNFEQNYRHILLESFEKQLTTTLDITWLLDRLNIPFCLATSSSRPRTLRALEITALNKYFSNNIFTTSEVAKGKPAPDLFLHASAKMQVPAEKCIVIEDSLSGIQAANAAGMDVFRYIGASHLNNSGVIKNDPSLDYEIFQHWRDLIELVPTIVAIE